MTLPTSFVQLPFALVSPSEVLAAGVVLPVVGFIAVALRIYARRKQKVPLGWDDWLSVPAVILLAGMGATMITGVALDVMGFPTPLPLPGEPPQQAVERFASSSIIIGKLEFAFQILMIWQLGFTKLCIVFFCRRVFVSSKRSVFDTLSIGYLIAVLCWMLALFLTAMLWCKGDLDYNWESLQSVQARCGNPLSPELAFVISDFLTDFFILLLPLPIIWSLNMSKSRKLIVSSVFLVGLM